MTVYRIDRWKVGGRIGKGSQQSLSRYREGDDGETAILNTVPAEDVTPYSDAHEGTSESLDERLIATSGPTLAHPEPIPYDAAKCIEGASEWGDRFLADFLVTTDRV